MIPKKTTSPTFQGLVFATMSFLQKTRGKMTVAILDSHQNDTGSRTHTLSLLENLILIFNLEVSSLAGNYSDASQLLIV